MKMFRFWICVVVHYIFTKFIYASFSYKNRYVLNDVTFTAHILLCVLHVGVIIRQ